MKSPKLDPMNRRSLLQAALAGGAACLSAPTLLGRSRGGDGLGSLILIELRGGNDGLSTLVPYRDERYHEARPTLGFGPDQVLPLDAERGLHPKLKGLRQLWDAGQLGVIEGVGYPRGNRSHFKSYEIWHTARRRGRSSGIGWLGRLADQAEPTNWARTQTGPLVHLGREAPYSLTRTMGGPVVLDAPESYRWLKEPRAVAVEANSASPRDRVAEVLQRSAQSSRVLREAIEAHRTRVPYPGDSFATSLQRAAALVHADLGLKVISTCLKGFDTHSDQRKRHDRLMTKLDRGLAALLADLSCSSAGRSSVVLVVSEFGRRLAENGSKGTDHGLAGLALALGVPVRGGWYGRTPDLTELDGGNPTFTTDFRSVFATIIEGGFGLPSEAVLGGSYPALDLLRAPIA